MKCLNYMTASVVNIASLLLSACQPAAPPTTARQNNSSSHGQATGLPSKIKIGWIDSMTERLALHRAS